jgi:sortase A
VTKTAPPPSTTAADRRADAPPTVVTGPAPPPDPPGDPGPAAAPPASLARLAGVWLLLLLLGMLVVWIGLSPSVEQRDQRALLADYQAEIESASNQAFGLPGIQAPTESPSIGSAVGVLDAERTGLHSVTIEGTEPAQTRQGPGHVIGTAGPGQPGNSAVVGRRHLYGSPFDSLGDMTNGDRILVTTVQGRSVYTVRYVGHRQIVDASASSSSSAPATTTTTAAPTSSTTAPADGAPTTTAPAAPAAAPLLPDGSLTPSQLFGPTDDDRLTLVTTDSDLPWSTANAIVVVAALDGKPYAPTPQGGRTPAGDGRHGDPGIFAPLALAALFALAAVVTAVWLHRYVPWRSAYLLSAPLLLAATILLAEQVAAAMPAWT